MRSERTDGVLHDILHHVNLATRFAEGLDREAFTADVRTVYAVTRCLEIISEASRRLPTELRLGIRISRGSKWPQQETSIVMIMKTSLPNLSGRPCSVLCRPSGSSLRRKLRAEASR